MICVGSIDYDNAVSWFSSPGPVTWADSSNYGDYPYTPGNNVEISLIKPDLVAPGNGIVSLKYGNTNEYVADAGTSFAAPSVTGVVALMLSKNPELTPTEIDSILQTTAVKLSEHKSNDFGSGLVDALAAVEAIGYDGMTESHQEVSVYPNPSSGSFTVTCEGLKRIQVFSLDGRLVQSIETTGDTEQIQGLAEGVYMLRITKGEAFIHHKIVKTKQ